MTYRALFFVLPLILTAPAAHADWINLANGDRLSGSVIAQDAQNVTIAHDMLGTLTLPRERIASIHAGEPPRVLARELRTGEPMSAAAAAVAAVAAPPDMEPSTTIAAKSETDPDVYKWTGKMSAGGTLEDGNSASKSVVGDATVSARNEDNRFTIGGKAKWAEERGRKTDNNYMGYGEYDRFLTDKWFVGGRQSLEHDEFQNLDLRSRSSVTVGYQFYEQDDLNLQIKAGPEFIYSSYDNASNEKNAGALWMLKYDQKFWENALQLFHNHDLSVPLSDIDAFLFNSETGLRVPVGDKFYISGQIDFEWDNAPAPGIKEGDTTYAVKAGYQWEKKGPPRT